MATGLRIARGEGPNPLQALQSCSTASRVPGGQPASSQAEGGSASQTPAGKAKAKARAQEDTQALLLKSSLNALQQLRLHHAVLFRTIIGPGEEVKEMLAKHKGAGDLYHQATVGKRGHGLGPPATYVWQATVVAFEEDPRMGPDTKQRLQIHCREFFPLLADDDSEETKRAEAFAIKMLTMGV